MLTAHTHHDAPSSLHAGLEKVESLFDRRFLRVVGTIVGAISLMYGGVSFLQGTGLAGNAVSFITMVVGVAVVLLSYALTRTGN